MSPLPLDIGGPFSLVDHTGRRWSDKDFRGSYLIIYFGYTSCPYTCSTAMLNIGLALDELGEDGKLLRPLFVTVDPEFDTPVRLAEYVARFHPRFLGLTGSGEEIATILAAYRTSARKLQDAGAYDRLFEHNPIAYLIGPDGQVATLLPPVLPPQRMSEIIRGYVAP